MKRIRVIAGLVVLCLLTACSTAPAEESTPTPLLPTEPPEQQQRTELPEPSNQKFLVLNSRFLAVPVSENITFYESLESEQAIPDPRTRDQTKYLYNCIYVAEEYHKNLYNVQRCIVKGGDLSCYRTSKNYEAMISLAPDYYCETADLRKIDLMGYLTSAVFNSPQTIRIEFNDGSYLLSIEIFVRYLSWHSTFYFDAEGRIITVFPNMNVKYAYKYDWNEDGVEDLFFLTGIWNVEERDQILVRNAEEDRKTLNTEYVDPHLFDDFIVYMSSRRSSIDFSPYGVLPLKSYSLNGDDNVLKRNPFYSMELLNVYINDLYIVGSNDFPTD